MPKCKKCNAQIYYLETHSGAHIPVNADSISERQKSGIIGGFKILFDPKKEKHITHFATCPFADKFRKPKTKGDK